MLHKSQSLICIFALLTASALMPSAFARGGGHSSGSHSSRSSRSSSPGEHYTNTYTTKRGTTVEGHYDTNPDSHFGNNYSTKGNINPHTGKEGTKVTAPNGEPQ